MNPLRPRAPRRRSTAPALFLLGAALLFVEHGCSSTAAAEDAGGDLSCSIPSADPGTFPEAKLYFEHNAADGDTGFHGLIDGNGWVELCVFDPSGKQILGAKPLSQLGTLGMGTLFWESREPPHELVTVQQHLDDFPPGRYEIRGTTFEGESLVGSATLTHDIPKPVTITYPANDSKLAPAGLVVSWEPVTETIDGRPVEVSGYECIVTNEEIEDPHGNAQPIVSIHVAPSVSAVTIPDEFMEPGTVYEIEVITLEVSGNQTIQALFFQTN